MCSVWDMLARFQKVLSEYHFHVQNTLLKICARFLPRSTEQRIIFMKIDIEGGEIGAIMGALPLFKAGTVQNLVVEVSPGC